MNGNAAQKMSMLRPAVEPTLQKRHASSDAVSLSTIAEVIATSIADRPVPASTRVIGPVPVSAAIPKTRAEVMIAPPSPNAM